MGLFNRVSSAVNAQYLRWRLHGVNFIQAKDYIIDMFKMMEKDGKERGGEYVIKKEIKDSINLFVNNPCMDTAISLLEKYPFFIEPFEFTKSLAGRWGRELQSK